MKTKQMKCSLIGLLLGAAASMSFAQDEATQERITRLLDASTVAGSELWDYKGNQIGTIEQVLVQPFGRAIFVVIDAEEILGEERIVAVPWRLVYVKSREGDSDRLVFALDATEAKLRAAPVYNAETGLDLRNTEAVKPIFEHWGVEMPGE